MTELWKHFMAIVVEVGRPVLMVLILLALGLDNMGIVYCLISLAVSEFFLVYIVRFLVGMLEKRYE